MPTRAIQIAAILVLLTGTALAQFKPSVNLAPQDRPKSAEEKKRLEALDRDYKAALEKTPTPDKPKAKDPWGNMRSGGAAKQGQ